MTNNKGKGRERVHYEINAISAENLPYLDEKQETENPPVDQESLAKLLDFEEAIQSGSDFPFFDDLHRSESYQTSIATCRPFDSQQITFYSSESNATLRSSSFGELAPPGRELQELFLPERENAVWWLDVQNPSEKALRLLCSAFHVHPLTIEDILMQESHEKMENFPSYYFACFRSFHIVEEGSDMSFDPYTLYVVVFREGTLSFSFSKSEHRAHVLDRIGLLKDYISISRDWIFYALVDDIVDSFAAPIAQIERRVNEIEDQVYTTRLADMSEFVRRIEGIRKSVISLTRLLNSKRAVLCAFDKHHSEEIPHDCPDDISPGEDIKLYIDDVHDHVVTMRSSLKQFEGLLARSQNNYLAQLDIDNFAARKRIHKFLGRASVISLALTLVNVLCGLFSTNVNGKVPLYANDSMTPWALIVSGEVVAVILLILLAWRCRWF